MKVVILLQNNKPVGIELNSNIHMYYGFGNHIYFISSMTIYVFFVWKTYFFSLFMPVTFEIGQTCISVQNTYINEVRGDSHKYFTFCKPYLFLYIYDLLSIPCLSVIFVVCKCV